MAPTLGHRHVHDNTSVPVPHLDPDPRPLWTTIYPPQTAARSLGRPNPNPNPSPLTLTLTPTILPTLPLIPSLMLSSMQLRVKHRQYELTQR